MAVKKSTFDDLQSKCRKWHGKSPKGAGKTIQKWQDAESARQAARSVSSKRKLARASGRTVKPCRGSTKYAHLLIPPASGWYDPTHNSGRPE